MVDEHIAALIERSVSHPSLSESQALCKRLAKTHYENFTLISWLVPRRMRCHLAALYAFCRTVDDIGDEAPGNRIGLLDRFAAELHAAYDARPYHPVIVALQHTIHAYDLPAEPFSKLIEANRIDQEKTRYETFAELLRYCKHSANPVGRLFLMLYGYRDEERFALSDATCTALQLTNFWQDIKRDFAVGRIYLPEDEMRRFGVKEEDLAKDRASDRVRKLLRFQVRRTIDYFETGLPLIDRVHGHIKIDIALFSRGGMAILDKIDEQGFDTLSARPTLATREKLGLFFSTLLARRWKTWIKH